MIKAGLNRRSFLKAAACTAAGIAVGPQAAFAKEAFGDWPVGIQSYTLRNFPVHEALRHIQGLGLNNVEMFSAHLAVDSNSDQIRAMLATLNRAHIHLRAHGVNSFTSDHMANRKVFEFAKSAGIRNITANPQPESFDSLEKLVEEYDVRVCIHNHGPDALYDTLGDVAKAVRGRHRLIGACIDTGHTLRSNEDPVKWVQELGPRVFALHLKDVEKKVKKTHDVVIGSAHLDLVGLFKSLKDVGFPSDGSISLEYESNPDNPIDDVKQCLVAAADAIAKVG